MNKASRGNHSAPRVKTLGRFSFGNIGPEDLLWLGNDGKLDFEAVLKEVGFDPYSALELLAGAIIDGHPGVPPSGVLPVNREERVRRAVEALTGVSRKRGNQRKDDQLALRKIARRYFQIWAVGGSTAVTPIIKELMSSGDIARGHSAQATIRRLERAFTKKQDALLVQASAESLPERWDAVRTMCGALAQLGIPFKDPIVS